MAEKDQQSEAAKREEAILKFWQERQIFEKSLAQESPRGEFVFYEGPPTANGRPGIHHLAARAFKDAIPRYKTMQGYHVRRKGGWDTHGLPVELQVEKELGLKSKKEVEKYGVAAFNQKCKESVWTYVHEWEQFTNRIGYWVDLKNPYITYKPEYIESLWNIVKTVDEKKLLYKDYKVVPWCPRCETALSSHELAQGYADVKDLAVTVKFKLTDSAAENFFQVLGKNPQTMKKASSRSVFLLAWTTTPWTLPGNVGLAVGEKINYVWVQVGEESYVLAEDRLETLKESSYAILEKFPGKSLVGLEYESLYPFLNNKNNGKAFKVYPAEFVTTEDGTGIVHTAVMYGPDDFELGTKFSLPKHHLVNEDGTFKKEAGFLAGRFVKDEKTDVEIIKDLASRNLLFAKEKYEHGYPFCWRCHTPLIYFARDSWYIKMSALRDQLVKENEGINWEPAGIKEGRFGEWLREVKDWAISRERYWGTPLPVWVCAKCQERKVIGSLAELLAARQTRNEYWVMRHGEAESNVKQIVTALPNSDNHLTARGREQVAVAAEKLKSAKIDLIVASPVLRTQETAALIAEKLGLPKEAVIAADQLRELNFGNLEGRTIAEFHAAFSNLRERFDHPAPGGEDLRDVQTRVNQLLYQIDAKYQGRQILLVTHEVVAWQLVVMAGGFSDDQAIRVHENREYFFETGEVRPLRFVPLPHDPELELDLHRPYIDEVKFSCRCGGEMARVKEVMDVWFDSGAMPFAQDHYPFEVEEGKPLIYPADFISEAIDQTRGWFYTLHAVGILLDKGKAYRNVICLGHILDAEGKKMSKSLGNIVNPWAMIDKYGADTLRFWMYSVNQPGDSKNFDEKTVDEASKKVINLLTNVLTFYQTYADQQIKAASDSPDILDRWILSRLNQLIVEVTTGLDHYALMGPTRAIRDFIGDLSQWYLRRSRDRFKSEAASDQRAAAATTRSVLKTLAKVMAPFMPFMAEAVFQLSKESGDPESVHLAAWPQGGKVDQELLAQMTQARNLVSRGLELRAKAGIKIRQPLSALVLKQALPPALDDLIKAELNVKELKIDANLAEEIKLDTQITSELKEEGELRDLIREIQDWRKTQGLKVGELVIVPLAAAKRALVEKYAAEIKVATKASGFEFK